MIDENGLHVYVCKDGRTRCYSPVSKKVTSYPRALMEVKLGYPLKPYEDVHHIDENPLNNDFNNLEIIKHGEHQQMHSIKYHNTTAICPYCGKEFVWSAKSQRNFYSKISRTKQPNKNPVGKPFCSKYCSGSYARREQLGRDS